jgi:acetyltransferase-like isoleucine patch superfamily enzyme
MALYTPLLKTFGMKVSGSPRYISGTVYFDDITKIQLGDRVVVSHHVQFLTHDYSLTTALIAVGAKPPTDVASTRAITVGNNVFIGLHSIILPNTAIGDNCIIGAGSVVRGEIPAGSVVMGNPARVVGRIEDYAAKCQRLMELGMARQD